MKNCVFPAFLIVCAGMKEDRSTDEANVPAAVPARKRLRVQPLAKDYFCMFSYACIGALMFAEFVALFWLDLF